MHEKSIILLFITNSPELAEYTSGHGVDRIMVDLEILGKHKRQGHLNTLISSHTIADIEAIRPFVPSGQLVVRINPIHESTKNEINQVIDAGADMIMLPMFRTPVEVLSFTKIVNYRVKTCLLVETVGAMQSLSQCIQYDIDEIHIGLNDLHLELGSKFMFELLANGLVDNMAKILRSSGKPFGIGGLARVGEGILPAELIVAEHARLGSTAAILSRTFHRQASSVSDIKSQMNFSQEIYKIKETYTKCINISSNELNEMHQVLQGKIAKILSSPASNTPHFKQQ